MSFQSFERGYKMASRMSNQNKNIGLTKICVSVILNLCFVSFCEGNATCEREDRCCSNDIDGDCETAGTRTCKSDFTVSVNPYVSQWQRPEDCVIDYPIQTVEPIPGSGTEIDNNGDEVHAINTSLLRNLEEWKFAKEKLLNQFPFDKQNGNFVRNVPNALFSKVKPTPLSTKIRLAGFSQESLEEILDMHPDITESEFFVAFVSGNTYLTSYEPLAHRYGGHQFGSWSGQLGDGRAHLLGEYLNRKGERWELQLKGSGLTPYSRRGDGRAVIRSSVREFLASEVMYHLGIPTTRAASLVVSNDPVWRDQFYDGHPKKERAAAVLRLAPSWFRIGSLEILAKNKEYHLLRQLTDFIIEQYFPEAAEMEEDDRYLHFYASVVNSTARLIAQWMSVGFAHGVMNTDNFSILSLTIDYGPFGFLDEYNPNFVPNTSDDEGMYAIANQATVGHFNLAKLREALLPLLGADGKERSRQILAKFADIYNSHMMNLFRGKLALDEDSETSNYLVALLLKMMKDTKSDFTMTFRQLGEVFLHTLSDLENPRHLWALRDLQKAEEFSEWVRLYQDQFDKDVEDLRRQEKMNGVNPRYILRNWMAQKVIEEVEKDHFEGLQQLHQILKHPFREQEEAEHLGYSSRPPDWSKELRVSCSS